LGRQSMGRLAAAPWIVWRRCGEALASWLRGVENEATPVIFGSGEHHPRHGGGGVPSHAFR
jgi:hypothetical protein